MAYATRQDFVTYGLPADAVASIDPDDLEKALAAASDFIDGYLRSRYRTLPPLSAPYPVSLVEKTCELAQFKLLGVRGFNPEATLDALIRMRYEDAISWCRDISTGKVTLDAQGSGGGKADGASVVQASSSGGSVVVRSPSLRGF